jgi:L-lactate dehydrogenase complex protein LldG
MERAEFLARLGRPRPGPALPDLDPLPQAQTELLPGEERAARFTRELEAVAGTVERVAPDRAAAAVAAALVQHGVRRVALADDLGPYGEAVAAALAGAGLDVVAYADAAADRERLGALDATVTGCLAAVAATGSIVTSATAGRAAALVAPVHVCVLRAEQLLRGLQELLRALPWLDGGSLVALQSGPSRSADIEKTLILGVHGPRVAHVVLVDGPAAGGSA